MSDAPHRLVIAGGGFSRLSAAQPRRGAPVDVTVVDRRAQQTFAREALTSARVPVESGCPAPEAAA